jgi:hypothetical protein
MAPFPQPQQSKIKRACICHHLKRNRTKESGYLENFGWCHGDERISKQCEL